MALKCVKGVCKTVEGKISRKHLYCSLVLFRESQMSYTTDLNFKIKDQSSAMEWYVGIWYSKPTGYP